ncbi:hypothetical protein ON05_000335 [Acaryochloris sp. CCMEE 5410]|nr:hypothetical protein ON05_000335 [Acaryochloris sp. CCMEE 5410]
MMLVDKSSQTQMMLTEILAEALAVTSDNLLLAKLMFDCASEATDELSLEARQRLGLVQAGLSLAFEGLECDELQELIQQADIYCEL